MHANKLETIKNTTTITLSKIEDCHNKSNAIFLLKNSGFGLFSGSQNGYWVVKNLDINSHTCT